VFSGESAVRRAQAAAPVRARLGTAGAVIGLILFCTLWRLPTLGDPPWLNDEGVYATVGKAILNGEALYRQIWENKPPAIYLLYGAVQFLVSSAHVLIGVRVAALLAAIIMQVAVYQLVRMQRGTATALLATALAGLLVDLPLLDGTSANAEIFVVACTSTGMLLVWRGMRAHAARANPRRFLIAGFLFGVAVLFKLVAGMDLVAALGIIAVWRATDSPERRAPAALALLSGVALPVVAVSVWLGSRGLLGIAFYATVTYNRGYVSTGQTLHGPLIELAALAIPVALIVVAISRIRHAAIRPSPGVAACWWLGLALIGSLASGRFYLHYFVQAVPPFAMAVALFLSTLADRRAQRDAAAIPPIIAGRRDQLLRRWLAGLLIVWTCGIPLVSAVAIHSEPAHASPGSDLVGYYAHVWQHLTGALDDTAFGNAMDPRVERNVAVATYLRDHPLAPRRLYVWGNAPWIYYLSGYEHAARFLSAYYNPPIPGGMAQVLSSLRRQPPPYVVVIQPATPSDAALSLFLQSHYRPVWRVENAVIYRLIARG
jgi:4-amino-4-deoxy-L-arabinose transferase-like glycosyltransferase